MIDWIRLEHSAWGDRLHRRLTELDRQRIVARIWEHDHRVWKPEPTEITNRLGWLHTVTAMQKASADWPAWVDQLYAEGYRHALLLGMGGSSLAPEVFSKTFGSRRLRLEVLDSTDPAAVLACAEALDLRRTLFIVSTKSGGTVETFSFFRYFYNRVAETLGAERAGEHFVAITDPGSALAETAQRYAFRKTFLNDPNIGGRYSALSCFGLVPAALIGVDLPLLLARAGRMMSACGAEVPAGQNPAAQLGAMMGELAHLGRDKLTFVVSRAIASFGDWLEQLIAESTGKEGTGILPVVGEPLAGPELYGQDRVFVRLSLDASPDDQADEARLQALEEAGHPVVRMRLADSYDLGGQFFLWELATAVAGHILGINPFDQPNVEAAKVLARHMVAEYKARGSLPDESPALTDQGVAVYGRPPAGPTPVNLRDVWMSFLGMAQPGDYLALQAYLAPTPATDAALSELRLRLRQRSRLATTVGYGPRFLHSTGQLHKGDAGHGLFVQITADAARDVPIPDEAGKPESSITFGVLEMAQALGDRQALLNAGRRVLRFHLKDALAGLHSLSEALA